MSNLQLAYDHQEDRSILVEFMDKNDKDWVYHSEYKFTAAGLWKAFNVVRDKLEGNADLKWGIYMTDQPLFQSDYDELDQEGKGVCGSIMKSYR